MTTANKIPTPAPTEAPTVAALKEFDLAAASRSAFPEAACSLANSKKILSLASSYGSKFRDKGISTKGLRTNTRFII